MGLIILPFYIFKFWYFEAPIALLSYFFNLNKSFFHFFSLPLMIRTFFKPWKNEYRKGLVGFSIFMGMVFKTLFIAADLVLFFFLILFEIAGFILFSAFPVLAFYLAFVRLI